MYLFDVFELYNYNIRIMKSETVGKKKKNNECVLRMKLKKKINNK